MALLKGKNDAPEAVAAFADVVSSSVTFSSSSVLSSSESGKSGRSAKSVIT